MMAKKDPRKNATSARAKIDEPEENLDTVRELLFGKTARAFEENIAAVEERLKDQLVATHKVTEATVEKLQSTTAQAISALETNSSADKQRQTDELVTLEGKVDALFNGLNADLSALARRTTESEASLNALVKSELTQLREQMQIQLSSLENKANKEIEAARADSVPRDTLAGLLRAALDEIASPADAAPKRKTGS